MSYEKVIRLASNVFSKSSHTNTVAHFLTDLKQAFDETGNWVVGVSEVSYTKSWLEVLTKDVNLRLDRDRPYTSLPLDLTIDGNDWEDAEPIAPAPARQNPDQTSGNEDPLSSDDQAETQITPDGGAEVLINSGTHSLANTVDNVNNEDTNSNSRDASTGNEINAASSASTPVLTTLTNNQQPDVPATPRVNRVVTVAPLYEDHDNYLFQPVILSTNVIFRKATSGDKLKLLETVSQTANYRGHNDGVYKLKVDFITRFKTVYEKEFPETDSSTIEGEAEKLFTAATSVRDIVMNRDQAVATFSPANGYIWAQSSTIHNSLAVFLRNILSADTVIDEMVKLTKKYLEGSRSGKQAWKNRFIVLFDMLPKPLDTKLNDRARVIDRLEGLLNLYQDEIARNDFSTPANKKQFGERLNSYVKQTRALLDPLTNRLLVDIANGYRSTVGSRKRRSNSLSQDLSKKPKLDLDQIDLSNYKVQAGTYQLEDLLGLINQKLVALTYQYQRLHQNTVLQLRGGVVDSFRPAKDRLAPKFEYDPVTDKITMTPGRYVNVGLENGLGRENQFKAYKLYPYLPRELAQQFGFASHDDSKDEVTIKDAVPVSRRGYYSLLLYSNIVKHTPVADTESQLLRLVQIPNNTKFGEQITITYDKPQFYPLSHNYFKQIEIKFLDDTGKLIPFQFGRSFVTLVLRKID